MHTITASRPARALSCPSALAVGDAFGSQFFVPANRRFLEERELPPGPWQWTDDTGGRTKYAGKRQWPGQRVGEGHGEAH